MARAVSKKKAAVKKTAAKKAAPAKAAAKKAAPKKAAAAKAPAKRPVGRPPGKKAAAPAKRPFGRPPAQKAVAAKAPAKRSVGRPPSKKAAAPAKRPVGRQPGKKAAAAKVAAKRPVGRPPSKKAAAKRPVGRPPGKKAAVAKAAAPRARVIAPAPRLKSAAPQQTFNVSHLNEADFKADGLRPYAQYRDLGIAAASGGLCRAHVIRLIPPCTDEVRKRHVHETELQLIYVLKGWIKNEFEGHGEQMMSAGSCWLQPPGIEHTVLDYSADCEMLEIIVPADFKTTEVA